VTPYVSDLEMTLIAYWNFVLSHVNLYLNISGI
jgi:hypothetical protein